MRPTQLRYKWLFIGAFVLQIGLLLIFGGGILDIWHGIAIPLRHQEALLEPADTVSTLWALLMLIQVCCAVAIWIVRLMDWMTARRATTCYLVGNIFFMAMMLTGLSAIRQTSTNKFVEVARVRADEQGLLMRAESILSARGYSTSSAVRVGEAEYALFILPKQGLGPAEARILLREIMKSSENDRPTSRQNE